MTGEECLPSIIKHTRCPSSTRTVVRSILGLVSLEVFLPLSNMQVCVLVQVLSQGVVGGRGVKQLINIQSHFYKAMILGEEPLSNKGNQW